MPNVAIVILNGKDLAILEIKYPCLSIVVITKATFSFTPWGEKTQPSLKHRENQAIKRWPSVEFS